MRTSGRLPPGVDGQLGEDLCDVPIDRANGHHELIGNLRVGVAVGEHAKYLQLTVREASRICLGGGRGAARYASHTQLAKPGSDLSR